MSVQLTKHIKYICGSVSQCMYGVRVYVWCVYCVLSGVHEREREKEREREREREAWHVCYVHAVLVCVQPRN